MPPDAAYGSEMPKSEGYWQPCCTISLSAARELSLFGFFMVSTRGERMACWAGVQRIVTRARHSLSFSKESANRMQHLDARCN